VAENPAPARFLVTIRDYPIAPAPTEVLISTHRLDLPRLVGGRLQRQEQRHAFVPESRFIESPCDWAEFRKSVTVVAEDPSPRKLQAMADDLRRYAREYLFPLETLEDPAPAIMAASLQIPVRLAYSDMPPRAVLEDLLDHFLHSPTLSVPIEPFYSLARAIGQRRDLTLWAVFGEALGRNYFVDVDRRVSLSPRWAGRGMFFGAVGEGTDGLCDRIRTGNAYQSPKRQRGVKRRRGVMTPVATAPGSDKGCTFTHADMENSELWRLLAGLKQRLFVSQAPCSFCAHYPYCGGIWTTARQPEKACSTWKHLMDSLVGAFRREAARAHR